MIKDNNPELYKTALALNPTGQHGCAAGDGEWRRVPCEPGRKLHH